MQSQIQWLTTGALNKVTDPVIGMAATPGGTGLSKFLGQLGKEFTLDSSMIVYDSTVGTVYGGTFRYVKFKAGAAAPVIGQAAFWDDAAAESAYQVTTAQDTTTYNATSFAGIFLNA